MDGSFLNNFALSQAVFFGGILGSIMISIVICAIVFYVIFIVAYLKILVKAGEKGWKALIPFYNVYLMYKIVNMKSWFWYLIGMSICAEIMILADSYQYNINFNQINIFDIAAHPMTSIAVIGMSIISLTALVIYVYRTSKVFGHGDGFAIGLLFFPYIFWLILAFGKSDYDKKRLKK